MRVISSILLLCFLGGCGSEFSLNPSGDLTLPSHPIDDVITIATDPHPVVRIEQKDYTEALVRSSVPDTSLLHTFTDAYQGKYTDSLKSSFVEWIGLMTALLGGNRAEVQKCLEATGELKAGIVRLPFIAERARYQGREAWLFQFVWGAAPNDLGHYRSYVMDTMTSERLLFITCR